MEKKEVRQKVLGQLHQLRGKPELKKEQEDILYQQLFQSHLWQRAQTIGITLSTSLELDTSPIIKKAWKQKKQVAVPKVLSKKEMTFIKINVGTKYEESSFGIREPLTNDIINKEGLDMLIVPGVAFRLDGYRVGFGGGFYDRYLVDYPGETCSLVLPEQLGFQWETMDYDVPVTTLFTL